MATTAENVQQILQKVPQLYRGPGGAVAVVKDGELVGEHVWGYANLNKHIPLASDTIMPICSISKQMVCGLLTDLERNPTPVMRERGTDAKTQFSDELRRLLRPELFDNTGLELRHLCNNQSGIRDYWALTVLWGAVPEGHFSMEKHLPLTLDRLRSFHFKPGTEYSYSNINFSIVGLVMENVTKQPLAELLAERIFKPAGMATAQLGIHTSELPSPCVGYEGDEAHGFIPALNCIEWAGDAGIVASLTDMINYEKFVDRTRDDPQSWYQTNATPKTFDDGTAAEYGYGLARVTVGGVSFTCHGGALRGYRLHRRYVQSERLSIIVLFNSEADSGGAATYIMKNLLSIPEPKAAPVTPSSDWSGYFLDPETKMAIGAAHNAATGEVSVTYRGEVEKMKATGANAAECLGMTATVERDALHIHRMTDNLRAHARRIAKADVNANDHGLQGEYRCEEIDSVFRCSGQGGMLYGHFEGFLGQGPPHLMRCLGQDVWALSCPRSMDARPPGDWTVVIRRDEQGAVAGVTIGCWLARRLDFIRTP
ncbi:beta-lactamase-type transpeptidase [Thozetella sp. PMI_491]|nr:beta-lactamase-type transpeptidase [Thozetella sp. PMI_491]